MNYKPPRVLRADEISCRIQQVTESYGAIILLYKDARTDMDLLDETFGVMNWQRKHFPIDGNLYCGIEVWDDDKKQWVMKQDVGTESNTEATKGEASDSFKRSGTNWGIGRELYTAGFIFIQLEQGEYKTGKNGQPQAVPSFKLAVKEIDYTDNREIKTLVIVDKNGRVRFTKGKSQYIPQTDAPAKPMQGIPVEKARIPRPAAEPVKVSISVTPEELAQRKKEVAALQKQYNITPEALKAFTDEIKCGKLNEQTQQEYTDFLVALQKRFG